MTTYTYDAQNAGDIYNRVRPKANQTGTTCPADCTTTSYTHDVLHRLTEIDYSDGTPTVQLQYDQSSLFGVTITNGKGRLTNAAADGGSSEITSSYDAMGRLQDQWQCTPLNCSTGSTQVSYGYNHLGEISSYSEGLSGINYTYNYDSNARVSSIQSSLSNFSNGLYYNLGYNALGEVVSATLGNTIARTVSYDRRGRPLNLTDGSEYTYTLSYTGNDITGADDSNGNWTYTYDAFNRIISSCSSDNQHLCSGTPLLGFTYDYDPFGNRWDQILTAGSGTGSDYSFKNSSGQIFNQITNAGVTYDAVGNALTDGLGDTFAYDGENHLTSVDNNSIVYTYDAFGRRIEQNNQGTKYDYVYSQGGIADLWTSAGLQWAQLLGNNTLGIYWLDSGSYTTNFYHENWLGTLRAMSTAAGGPFSTCTDQIFGDNMHCTIGGPGDIHFTGQEDDNAGLTHFPMRNYSMTQGRWMHTDPAGLAAVDITNPQTWNRYGYVMNDPADLSDPLGLAAPTQCDQVYGCNGGGGVPGGGAAGGGGGFGGGVYGGAFSGSWTAGQITGWATQLWWGSSWSELPGTNALGSNGLAGETAYASGIPWYSVGPNGQVSVSSCCQSVTNVDADGNVYRSIGATWIEVPGMESTLIPGDEMTGGILSPGMIGAANNGPQQPVKPFKLPLPNVPPGDACNKYPSGSYRTVCNVTGNSPTNNCVRGNLLDLYDPNSAQYQGGARNAHCNSFAACGMSWLNPFQTIWGCDLP